MRTLDDLPSEIIQLIVDRLDQLSLLSAIRTCNTWYWTLSPHLWRKVSIAHDTRKSFLFSVKVNTRGVKVFQNKAFWRGVRRFGPCIRSLSLPWYEALEPFLQVHRNDQGEGGQDKGERRKGEGGDVASLDLCSKKEKIEEESAPCVNQLRELEIKQTVRMTDLVTKAEAAVKERPLWFLQLLMNNPGLETVRTVEFPMTAEWQQKRLLGPVLGQELGRGLKTLEIDIRMNSNDPNHHLVWFLRNFPLTVEDFSLTIQFVRSTPVQISDPEKVERSEQGSVSTTVITANATAQKGKQDHSCNCVMGQDDELAFAVPLSIKNLSLYGFYPLPEPDELEFTPGSSSATRSRTTSPFLTALENLIRRSPELSSIKVDNICHDYGTAIRRTRWLGLEDVTAMLKPYRAKSREFESVIAPRLVKFTSSQGWTDEVLAEFLNRWDSTLSPSKTLNGGQDCQDHRVDHSKDDNDDVENVVVGWKTLELAEVQESFSKTSAAILHQTQHLENLTLSSSEGFPPQELAWILRTSPRLNCFSTIEDNAWPKEGHEYPYLNVFLEAQDLLLPLHQIQGFWSTWTDRKRPHPQNLGWHPKRHGSDNEHGYGGFLAWVASENLEILRVVIKNVPRPDLKRSQFGGTLGQCREGTLAHEDYQDPRVALQVEQELCRRIGRLTNLKELVLGMDDRKWGDLNYYRSLPKRLRKELGLPLLTPVKDPDREEEQKEIGVKDGDNGGTVADEEDVYSDADNAWNECPRWEPLMFYDEGFQYSCLSLALDAGLGYLAGLGQLEVLKVNRMSHRIRLQEVQWMAEHWPRLRRIEGLKVLRKDDKCPIPPVTEEAVIWLERHCPWIELVETEDNLRQHTWRRRMYGGIWH